MLKPLGVVVLGGEAEAFCSPVIESHCVRGPVSMGSDPHKGFCRTLALSFCLLSPMAAVFQVYVIEALVPDEGGENFPFR